jgi:hypothetical protein
MRDVGADPPARAIDPLLDLHRERIHPRPRPDRHRQPIAGRIARRDPMSDCLVITSRQLRRTTQRAGQVERFQDLHHFLRVLQARPPGTPRQHQAPGLQADPDETGARSNGHPWGDPAAASGEIRWPPTGRFPWPPSLGSVLPAGSVALTSKVCCRSGSAAVVKGNEQLVNAPPSTRHSNVEPGSPAEKANVGIGSDVGRFAPASQLRDAPHDAKSLRERLRWALNATV